jgi:hypothetical protein
VRGVAVQAKLPSESRQAGDQAASGKRIVGFNPMSTGRSQGRDRGGYA